jgi:hypothetical protein
VQVTDYKTWTYYNSFFGLIQTFNDYNPDLVSKKVLFYDMLAG